MSGNVFARAAREWDDRYARIALGKRNWQLAALGLLLADLLLTAGLVWLATSSRVVPYVVEVDPSGEAVTLGPAETLRAADPRLVRYQLSQYLINLRTVLADSTAQRLLAQRAYAFTRGTATDELNRHFRTNDPRAQGGRTVKVDVHSILPLSKSTWQLQWQEIATDPNGRTPETSEHQAVLTVEVDPPGRADDLLDNPLGLYVTDIHWTESL